MALRRRRGDLTVFGLSALDLFASGMGAFVVLAVLMFPNFRKIEPILADTRAMTREARSISETVVALKDETAEAERRLDDARKRTRQAAAEASALEAETAQSQQDDKSAAIALSKCQATVARLDIRSMDLVLAFDSTGSMSDAMADLRRSLNGVVRVLRRMIPDLRIGLVTFRDDASFITRSMPLTGMDDAGVAQALDWLKAQGAEGGTGPQAVAKGITVAAGMAWRDVARAVVVIGDDGDDDGAPHNAERLARSFAASGARARVSAISVRGQDGAFFEAVAKAGGGTYHVDPGGRMLESILLAALEK